MGVGLIVAFVVIFALVLLAVSVGLKYFDSRRKKQMVDMLQTASGDAPIPISTLLKEIETDKPSGLKGIIKSLQFSKHAQQQIQQAGLSWSSTRLITAMGLASIPGLGLGALLPFVMNGLFTAIILGTFFAATPYLYIRHKRTKRLNTME